MDAITNSKKNQNIFNTIYLHTLINASRNIKIISSVIIISLINLTFFIFLPLLTHNTIKESFVIFFLISFVMYSYFISLITKFCFSIAEFRILLTKPISRLSILSAKIISIFTISLLPVTFTFVGLIYPIVSNLFNDIGTNLIIYLITIILIIIFSISTTILCIKKNKKNIPELCCVLYCLFVIMFYVIICSSVNKNINLSFANSFILIIPYCAGLIYLIFEKWINELIFSFINKIAVLWKK